MPTKKDAKDGVTEVKVKDSALPVRRVETPEDPGDEFHTAQAEALLHYKSTGEVGDFIDIMRDQEPDIAPEFGVSPHPELKNPPPPPAAISAVASNSPVVRTVEEKTDADNASAALGAAAGPAASPANPSPAEGATATDADAPDTVDTPGVTPEQPVDAKSAPASANGKDAAWGQ